MPTEPAAMGHGRVVDLPESELTEEGVARLCRGALGDVPASLVAASDAPLQAGLRVETRATPDGRRLVLHLLNYNVPLESNRGAQAIEGIRLRLPMAPGRAWYSVLLHDPRTEAATPLPLRPATPASVEVTIPRLQVYAVLEVTE